MLRELEKKHSITEFLPSKQAKERSMTKNELEMMKCTNVLSQKMAMQTILKDVLQSKYEMNTNEFTSTLMLKALVSSSTKRQLATSAGSPTAINVW